MKIHTCIPFSIEKDISKEYNYEMNRLPNDDDFCCFIDHDASFTTYFWYNQLTEIVNKYPECGCFVAVTNRIGGERQRADVKNDYDVRFNRNLGEQRKAEYGTIVEDFSVNTPHDLCGFLILLKKSVWKKIGGFEQWSESNKMLGVDSKLHRKLIAANEKVYIMLGVYLDHYYSAYDGQGSRDKSHLI